MIVFDLDDTLFKERDFVASGTIAVHQYMRQQHPELTSKQISDMPWDAECLSVYRNHKPQIAFTADAKQSLDFLLGLHHPLALVTDGRIITQRNKIIALGLNSYIADDDIYISQATGFDKTHPSSFHKIMFKHPDERSFCYIGDNPAKDFLWPNRLGWDTAMLLDKDGVNVHTQNCDDLEFDYRPVVRISNILDFVKSWLKRNGYLSKS